MINIMSDITFMTYVKVSQPKPPEESAKADSFLLCNENPQFVLGVQKNL